MFILANLMGPQSIFMLGIVMVPILLSAFARITGMGGAAPTLVIRKWTANTEPDANHIYVFIEGRRAGLIAWLLSVLGIDAKTELVVSAEAVEFRSASLAGGVKRVIPLSSVSSTIYGYSKPWMQALLIFAIITALIGVLAESVVSGVLLGLIVAVIYFVLNRQLTVGLIEESGHGHIIQFKKSVIENQEINEKQAERVSRIIQALVQAKN